MTKIETFNDSDQHGKFSKKMLTKFEMFRNISKIHIKSRFFHIMTVIQIFDFFFSTNIEIFRKFWLKLKFFDTFD